MIPIAVDVKKLGHLLRLVYAELDGERLERCLSLNEATGEAIVHDDDCVEHIVMGNVRAVASPPCTRELLEHLFAVRKTHPDQD